MTCIGARRGESELSELWLIKFCMYYVLCIMYYTCSGVGYLVSLFCVYLAERRRVG